MYPSKKTWITLPSLKCKATVPYDLKEVAASITEKRYQHVKSKENKELKNLTASF